ncbi:MAG TPA: lactate racemase domain-containing protein [Ktedonobacteraceae bacterium]|nr:lactate racemase domain-containing protein [Ktedonobacteraceae bacterium]
MSLFPYQDTAGLLRAVPFPDMVLLRQRFPQTRIDDVPKAVVTTLEQANIATHIHSGARIAIAVGSRGIADIALIVRALVATLRHYGAEPFIVPAMGSHGGATAEGQRMILESLGVTETFVGAPIISSLDVDVLGTLSNGMPIHIDRMAHAADGIVVVNRIKPHTDFEAPIESGLSKMVAIGLGKHAGALTIHSWGVEGLSRYTAEAAKFAVARSAILFGLAIVENASDEVAEIAVVPAEGIGNEPERALLEHAKAMMPRLPWDSLDVLVIDKMGKNISGAGMDTNIIGRMRCTAQQKATAAKITNVTVHDLTEESHGNAIGLGLADFTTAHVINKADTQAMYINSLTAGVIAMESAKIPMVLETDREAVAAALRSCGHPDPTMALLARIENTLRLEYILASVACLDHLRSGSYVEVMSAPHPFTFRSDGSLTPFGGVFSAFP